MKIVFYSPYLPKHTGGGEKYLLDAALLAAESGHQVYVAVSRLSPLTAVEHARIKDQYELFLDRSLASIKFIAAPLHTQVSWWRKLWWTKQFDCIYYQTDGSLFFSLAKKNILHIQIPLLLDKSALLERLKLNNWTIKNTNSYFTKTHIEKAWQTKIDFVHQPFVELPSSISQIKKSNMILSVGRFFTQLHSKRQDVLVKLFHQLRKQEPQLSRGWELVLVGKIEDSSFAQEVQELAADLPIRFLHDLDRQELLQLYGQAKIYWHAAGLGIDEQEHPEKVEHFGIATLEAMAAGTVPVVVNQGGQREIVTGQLQQLLWQTERECLDTTIKLMKDESWRQEMAKLAQERSRQFSVKKFKEILCTMLES